MQLREGSTNEQPNQTPSDSLPGKFHRTAPWIIEQMPDHVCYVESFGGAGVLLQKPRSYSEVYNDLDGEVVNLFRVLRDPELNQRLQDACCLTPYSRDEFCHAQEPATDSIERARRMVVRAQGIWFTAGVGGQSDSVATANVIRYCGASLGALPDQSGGCSPAPSGVIIENKDALAVMRAHDAETTLHYIDPPYVPETRVQVIVTTHEMTVEGHEQLLAVSRTMSGMVMIGGYDTEVYNDMLTGWAKRRKTSRISAGRGTKVRRVPLA